MRHAKRAATAAVLGGAVAAVAAGCSSASDGQTETTPAPAPTPPPTVQSVPDVELNTDGLSSDTTIVPKGDGSLELTKPQTKPDIPAELRNALESARSYVELMGFSKQGLIEQLEFEGYSTSTAVEAVSRLDVSWKQEAVESAKSYLDLMSFSRSGLLDQLLFEGFTQAQAEYAVNQVY